MKATGLELSLLVLLAYGVTNLACPQDVSIYMIVVQLVGV
jgi:hypothetical protein